MRLDRTRQPILTWKLLEAYFQPRECRICVGSTPRMSNLCRIYVELMSNSCPQNSFGHEMASQTAVWAENLSILYSCLRGIRFWHSRGLVPDNFRRKSANPFFQQNLEFPKKIDDPAFLHGEKRASSSFQLSYGPGDLGGFRPRGFGPCARVQGPRPVGKGLFMRMGSRAQALEPRPEGSDPSA